MAFSTLNLVQTIRNTWPCTQYECCTYYLSI